MKILTYCMSFVKQLERSDKIFKNYSLLQLKNDMCSSE